MNRPRIPFARCVSAALAALVLLIGVRVLLDPLRSEFGAEFATIEVGMTESAVIATLGAPDQRSETFYLGQRSGYDNSYRRAAQSDSDHYLVYNRGIDLVYSIGIGSSGTVTIKEVGGT